MSPLLVLILAVLATTHAGPIVRFALAVIGARLIGFADARRSPGARGGGLLALVGIAVSLGSGERSGSA